MEENTKKCIHCKEVKKLELFRKNDRCKSGIGNVCKKCYSKQQSTTKKGAEKYIDRVMYGLDDSDRW
jgi:hypothetical protein